jgi:hypothetical protein
MSFVFGPWKLSENAGYRSINKPVDVALIQDLLIRAGANISVNGYCDANLVAQIKKFQTSGTSLRPDGVISPHGPTFARLLRVAGKFYGGPYYLRDSPVRGWWTTKPARFASLFAHQFQDRARIYTWTTARPVGLAKVFEKICRDPDIMDLRWAAYMLATCQRECPSFVPVSEGGKGAGRPYGKPEIFKASNGKSVTNTYYGRGYVQLTWGRNYLAIGKAIGLGEDLAIHPDDALKPDIAYKVMSYGMRKGAFTGTKLANFIVGDRADYFNARTIINGHDHAAGIADCARQIASLIRLATPDRAAWNMQDFPSTVIA